MDIGIFVSVFFDEGEGSRRDSEHGLRAKT
jgi:hypothetical protein